MTAAVSRILRQLQGLGHEEQSEVADALLQMLTPPGGNEEEEALQQKLLQRMAEIQSGQVQTIPLHQVLADIRKNR